MATFCTTLQRCADLQKGRSTARARAGAAWRLRHQHQLRHGAAGAGAGPAEPVHRPGHELVQLSACGASTSRATTQRAPAPAPAWLSRSTAQAASWCSGAPSAPAVPTSRSGGRQRRPDAIGPPPGVHQPRHFTPRAGADLPEPITRRRDTNAPSAAPEAPAPGAPCRSGRPRRLG